MDEGKIYITISDTRNGGGNGEITPSPTPSTPTGTSGEKEPNLLGDFVKHKFYNMVQEQTKQIINYSIANIGNFTGDYQVQREVETGVKVVNMGINLATTFAGGFIATGGNIVGGVAAVGIMVASQTINFALQETANRVSNRNQNYNIEQLRNISGLDALTNGGR